MNRARRDEIRARCRSASPGPWFWDEMDVECDSGVDDHDNLTDCPHHYTKNYRSYGRFPECLDCEQLIIYRAALVDTNKLVRYDDYFGYTDNDAEFIKHARQDVPALLGEIERLEKELMDYAVSLVRIGGDCGIAMANSDYWKAMAKAMEKALRSARCTFCAHPGDYCTHIVHFAELCDKWKFDQARFAKEVGEE